MFSFELFSTLAFSVGADATILALWLTTFWNKWFVLLDNHVWTLYNSSKWCLEFHLNNDTLFVHDWFWNSDKSTFITNRSSTGKRWTFWESWFVLCSYSLKCFSVITHFDCAVGVGVWSLNSPLNILRWSLSNQKFCFELSFVCVAVESLTIIFKLWNIDKWTSVWLKQFKDWTDLFELIELLKNFIFLCVDQSSRFKLSHVFHFKIFTYIHSAFEMHFSFFIQLSNSFLHFCIDFFIVELFYCIICLWSFEIVLCCVGSLHSYISNCSIYCLSLICNLGYICCFIDVLSCWNFSGCGGGCGRIDFYNLIVSCFSCVLMNFMTKLRFMNLSYIFDTFNIIR